MERVLGSQPTPFFPVPEVGPWDMYTDAAALGLSIVWQTKKGEWRSCALQKGICTHRPATEWPGVTSAEYGDEVNYMQAHWVRVINFMGSLYQWEFRKNSSAPAFLPLLKPYPARVRTVTIDFFNQKFVISAAKKITRDVPRLQSMEANSTKLRNLYGHELAIGYPPQAGCLGSRFPRGAMVSATTLTVIPASSPGQSLGYTDIKKQPLSGRPLSIVFKRKYSFSRVAFPPTLNSRIFL